MVRTEGRRSLIWEDRKPRVLKIYDNRRRLIDKRSVLGRHLLKDEFEGICRYGHGHQLPSASLTALRCPALS